MKFIDSNILAYAFYKNEHTSECQEVIRVGGVTDTFNLIEAFFIIEKETGSRAIAQRSVRALMRSNLEIVAVDVNVIFEALKQAPRRKLSIFDLIHYCCAVSSGCEAILSYDKDFDAADLRREEP